MISKERIINGETKKEQPQPEIRYSWQFWCTVAGVIAAVALVLAMGFLSIKAMVQNVQILFNDIENPKLIQKRDIQEETLPKDCRGRKAPGTGYVSER